MPCVDTAICRVGVMHSENAQATQLFVYCSDDKKEEQRGVVRFLVAEGAATRYKVKTPWNGVGRNYTFA